MKRCSLLIIALCLCMVLTACGGAARSPSAPTPSEIPTDTLPCGGTDSHNLKPVAEIPASCIRDGYLEYACECGVVVYDTTPADESLHIWTEVDSWAGGGLSDGYKIEQCLVCGEQRISALGDGAHAHGELLLMDHQDPTCTEAGYLDNRCSVCEEQIVTILPAVGHDYSVTVKGDSPCESAVATYTCTRCGDTFEKTISAAHAFDIMTVKYVDATCTEPGSFTAKCDECGQEISWTVPARGHDYAVKNYTAPHCMGDGIVEYECSRCGDAFTKTVPAFDDHVYELVSITEPTCVDDGEITGKCHFCGEEYKSSIPANGEHEWDIQYNESCTEIVVWQMKCQICGAAKTEKKDHYGHIYGTGEIEVVEPTCTEQGIEKGKCAVCGEAYEITVDPYGHDFKVIAEPGTFELEATCTHDQYYTLECIRCGERKQVAQAGQIRHFIDQSGPVDYDLMCGEPIVEKGTCLYCGQYVECVGDILNHEYLETGKTQAHTVTEEIPSYDEWDELDEEGNVIEHHKDVVSVEIDEKTVYVREYECMYCHDIKWG